nr:ABC transporter permease [uncultured Solibaculum sp.]
MSLSLEIQKLKRTGYFLTFLAGAALASAFPLVNMLVRPENFVSLPGDPFAILVDANWQMMAMLNILISICGACMMYHTEYADNGIQKMDVLPVRSSSLFFSKFAIASFVLAIMIAIETLVLTGCSVHWFPSYQFDFLPLAKSAGFQWVVTLPTVMLMLILSSACKNMWISLGIGVILVFTLSILPQDNLILSLFPFSSPYQTFLTAMENGRVLLFLGVCIGETIGLGLIGVIYQSIRRCYQ